LNEQKISSLSQAAVFADEFVLTHKVVFQSPRSSHRTVVEHNYSSKTAGAVPKDDYGSDSSMMSRECFYCHEKGHLIAACPVLQRKNQRKTQSTSKSVALVHTHSSDSLFSIDPSFEPFVCEGVVAFSDLDPEPKPVRILRDTGAAQSFILADVLPFSSQSSCNSDVLAQGFELGVVRVPLHVIYLRSDIVTGLVKVAVRTQLPLKGISLILGNDLAGSKVSCLPEVTEVPFVSENDGLTQEFPGLFRSCVVTRAQAHKFEN